MSKEHILVVDEDETIRCMLSHALALSGFEVTTTASAEEALLLLSENAWMGGVVNLMLIDIELPGISGLELLDELSRRGNAVPTIIMSGVNGKDAVSGAVQRRCVGYFPKPFRLHSLLGAIRGYLEGAAQKRGGEEIDKMLEMFFARS
jgi:two-component system response regulator FlrC